MYGILVSGGWQRKSNTEDENNITKGRGIAYKKFEIECNIENTKCFSEEEIDRKEREIVSIKNQLELLGNTSYRWKRYEKDSDFIREMNAIFAIKPNNPIATQKELWERLNWILRRLAEFCAFKACILLFTEPDNPDNLSIVNKYPEDFNVNANIHMDDSFVSKLFEYKKNRFLGKPQEEAGALCKLLEEHCDDNIGKITTLGVCPLDFGKEKCILIMINRLGKSRSISTPSEDFITRFVGHFIPVIRNILTLIELRKAENARQEIIMLTVHTLNSHMDGIQANSTLLERMSENYSSVNIADFLLTAQKISEHVTHLATTTKTFYYSTVINAGKKIDFRFDKSFSIMKLLNKCREKFVFFAKERNIRIDIEELHQQLPDIVGDEEKIELVFDNLIHNAIKFSHNTKYVTISARCLDTKKIIVSVNNFGFGIPSDEKEKIFQPFFRSIVKDPRRPIPGTGLGLSIAKNVVDAHHGTIEITSKREKREYTLIELNKGENWVSFNTTFSVSLPIGTKF